jgi:3-hydroxyacyl-CoA dehydrogenase/enoyl-CoA hydratase/3-hydroxybutyryl-CoA epimerase
VWKKGKIEKSDQSFNKADMERLGRELVDPMIVEAQKSLDEKVVETADLVDAGLVFGTGFAPFRGGPLHYRASETGAKTTRAAAE